MNILVGHETENSSPKPPILPRILLFKASCQAIGVQSNFLTQLWKIFILLSVTREARQSSDAMSMRIIRYSFEGPFDNVTDLKNESGAFVVFGARKNNSLKGVLDTGAARDIRAKVEGHKNKESWANSGYDSLQYAAHYGDESDARVIAGEIVRILEPDYTEFEIKIKD